MTDDDRRWSMGKRIGFLFLGLYLALNAIPVLAGAVPPVGDVVQEAWRGLWAALMPTLGNAVFGIEAPISMLPTGSGDMTWNYVQQFWLVVLSAVAAVIWAVLDRRRADYAHLYAWLRIVIRYALATAMFYYGNAKLTGNQFVPPDAMRLTETYGDSSPMGLAWTFMGFSGAYCAFAGLMEIAAGALLIWRRTATLGALVACGVLANVVMINFCFDVAVKLYSSQLLLMAVFLLGHDARRLFDLLVRNRATAPADLSSPALGRQIQRARVIAKSLYVLMIAAAPFIERAMVAEMMAQASAGPLYGLWDVETFTLDGTPRPAQLSEAQRWRQLFVGEFPYAVVRPMQGEQKMYGFSHDADAGTVTLTAHKEGEKTERVLQVELPAANEMVLRGTTEEGEIEATLRKHEVGEMLLVSRGFRWISERPFNR